MLSIDFKFLFKTTNRAYLCWLFLNCIILFQFKATLAESVDATASSLTLDDSIDQSTSTVQNANQETVIANSTGNLLNDPTSYYVSAPNELIDNETNSSPIVISNNVSTNRLLQQGKPNTTFESRIVETINDSPSTDRNDRNKQINMYTDQINGGAGSEMAMFNYAASSPGPDQYSSQPPVSTSTLSSTTARSSNKNHYEFLNTNSLPLPPIREQASAFSQPSPFGGNPPLSASFNSQQPASAFSQQAASTFNQQAASFAQQSAFAQNSQATNKILPPIDDLIEFRLNGSTPFSKFIAEKAMSSTPSSSPTSAASTTPNSPPVSQMTPTPSTLTLERSAGAAASALAGNSGESSIGVDAMPELYNAPLSSFASTLQQVNQQKHKQSNGDKNLHLNANIIPKNMPSSHTDASPANQTSIDHPVNAAGSPSGQTGENRYRWVNNYTNRNKLPPYPPKQPNIPGIPSGFRNPISTPNTLPPSNNNLLPSGMLNGVSTPPLNSGSNSAPYLINSSGASSNANNINLASIVNSLSAPNNLHQPSFGGSSLNPTGFPYPTANNLIGPPSIFTNGVMINPNLSPEVEAEIEAGLATATHSFSRRPGVNITRVEHIAAECSDDYMKVVINFNGTFTGLVYSSGYVHDANCIYVNGTGRNGYEFYIRLNQCGTMGREEMHHPKRPGEVRRRDQVMWNTLSIQYNGLIEEEWDEHYRVTCEYGSDYWKTVTFPAFNVEVNTGSPVVFTINPPQCQMEVRRGFGIAGSRTTGPVTVGDPLTLLIHMKSEKAGFDILVKNCISHNGGTQRLQLIDTNGCVTNEKLISPFRGTYNSDDGHQVTLYAYLKAFRFTGSPALYLECDIHMCHNKCPPQRCYWRNLSKRSISNETYYENEQYGEPFSVGRYNFTLPRAGEQPVIASDNNSTGVISESLSLFQALEVRHSDDTEEDYDEAASLSRYDHPNSEFVHSRLAKKRGRKGDALRYLDEFDSYAGDLPPQQKFCFTGLNLTFVSISTITVLISAISMSILSCLRLRKLKIDYLRYDDRLSAISKSTSSKTAMFYNQPHFSRRY